MAPSDFQTFRRSWGCVHGVARDVLHKPATIHTHINKFKQYLVRQNSSTKMEGISHELVSTFIFYCSLVLLKTLLMAFWTAKRRFATGVIHVKNRQLNIVFHQFITFQFYIPSNSIHLKISCKFRFLPTQRISKDQIVKKWTLLMMKLSASEELIR